MSNIRKLAGRRLTSKADDCTTGPENRAGEEMKEEVEARVGIEPTHKGFADLSLTTWVPRLIFTRYAKPLVERGDGKLYGAGDGI